MLEIWLEAMGHNRIFYGFSIFHNHADTMPRLNFTKQAQKDAQKFSATACRWAGFSMAIQNRLVQRSLGSA